MVQRRIVIALWTKIHICCTAPQCMSKMYPDKKKFALCKHACQGWFHKFLVGLWDQLISNWFWPNDWQNSNIRCSYNKQCTYTCSRVRIKGWWVVLLGISGHVSLSLTWLPAHAWLMFLHCCIFVFEHVDNYSQDSVCPLLQFLYKRDKKKSYGPQKQSYVARWYNDE